MLSGVPERAPVRGLQATWFLRRISRAEAGLCGKFQFALPSVLPGSVEPAGGLQLLRVLVPRTDCWGMLLPLLRAMCGQARHVNLRYPDQA
jgi:hypothetical protein